jgi:hypothetical protein
MHPNSFVRVPADCFHGLSRSLMARFIGSRGGGIRGRNVFGVAVLKLFGLAIRMVPYGR